MAAILVPRRPDERVQSVLSRRVDGPFRGPPLPNGPLHSPPRPLSEVAVKYHYIDLDSAYSVGPQCLEQAARFGGEGNVDDDGIPVGSRYVEVAVYGTDVQSK